MNTLRMNYLVPTVIEKSSMGERAYDIYSRLLKERIVFLNDEINSATANIIIAQLLHLAYEDSKKDIFLYINSPGGVAYDCLAIYDTMNYIRPDIQTTVMGMAASAAGVLLASGTKGKRFALPHSKIMIHQPHGGGGAGTITDQEINLQEALRLKGTMEEIMVKNTGQKKDKIHIDMERDFYMTAQEAKNYGIIDQVIEKA